MKRFIRILAVVYVFCMVTAANPFRALPDELAYLGASRQVASKEAASSEAASLEASSGEGAFEGSSGEVALEPLEEEVLAALEFREGATRSETTPAPDDLLALIPSRTKAPAESLPPLLIRTPAPEGGEPPAQTPEPTPELAAMQPAATQPPATQPAATQPPENNLPEEETATQAPLENETLDEVQLALNARTVLDGYGEGEAPPRAAEKTQKPDVVWQPTPTPTPRPTKARVTQNQQPAQNQQPVQAQGEAEIIVEEPSGGDTHPVLGTVEKTWHYKETNMTIRVDKRKIGNNRAFIATVRAPVSRMGTYTVAGPGETGTSKATSTLARGVDAAIAINGDFFDYYTRRGQGIVVRNGVLYNNVAYGRWCYAIYNNGYAEVARDYDLNAEDMLMRGVKDVFAFGPALVKDGKFIKPDKENTHPRTAIGRIGDEAWILIVVDGRQSGYSVGMTYEQLASLFIALGCDTAYNLDGGGSSAMWLNGVGVLNSPSEGKERRVPDIIFFR